MLGIFLLLIALLVLVFNLRTSYVTEGGALGQVPVFGASIIQIPLLMTVGLALIEKSGRLHLEWWHYPLICLVLAVCSGILVSWVGNYAKRA
ncbi:MAG: hypothetical protein PHG89_05500 [Gallionella sp.]|nr:hypothetical protein [Gallionella sp.]